MATFSVVSDVTFDLVLKKIEGNSIPLKHYLFGNVVSDLIAKRELLKESESVIVHIDNFFFRYEPQQTEDIMNALIGFSKHYLGNLLISNSIIGPEIRSLGQSLGEFNDGLLNHNATTDQLLNAKNVYFYDFRKILFRHGMKNAYNFELGHLYQMPYTVSVIDELALLLIQQMLFLAAPEKKVIVVDCDDTLWNGIVGEDGVDKIYCDRNSRGIVHLHFQQFLKKKKDEGFLLCICSKNNEQDVEEAFRKKKMPLSSEDFILKKVNWKSKPDNIRELASELSLGLDSFIMIDDSQFEVDYIKEVIPEITVLRFSKRYIDFLNLIDDFAFRRKRYTTEDINKTEQYIIEQKRQEAIRTITSFEDYILQLQLKMDISLNNIGEIERYAQMTEKTNQFNFNKEIFTIKQLEDFIVAGGLLYGMKLTDKFGDYGTVGMMLIETGNDLAIVRNYLMSCRALGRGVEEKFFDRVLGELDHKGLKLGGIKFQVTPKNKPAQEFYHKRFKKDE